MKVKLTVKKHFHKKPNIDMCFYENNEISNIICNDAREISLLCDGAITLNGEETRVKGLYVVTKHSHQCIVLNIGSATLVFRDFWA